MYESRKPVVLVVDDERNILDIIGKILRINGCETVLSTNVNEALETLKTQKFDLLITDHLMPHKTGLELVIETKDTYPEMVKILLTGVGNRDLYREAINKGDVFSVVEKPFLTNVFMGEVNRAIAFHKKLLEERRETQHLKEQYHTIFDKTTDLIQCVDMQGRFIYVNPSWHRVLKFDKDEIALLSTKNIVHIDYFNLCDEISEKAKKDGNVEAFEISAVARDGTLVNLEGTATAQYQDNEPVAIVFILRDITDRIIASEEIRQRLRQETMIANVAKLLTSTDEPVTVYEHIIEIIGESVNADYVILHSFEKKTGTFVKINEWLKLPGICPPETISKVSTSIIPYIYEKISHGETVYFSDTASIPEPDRTVINSTGTKSILFIPIKIVKKIVGSLGFVNIQSQKKWEKNEITLLNAGIDILANGWRRQLEINARKQKEIEAEQSKLLVLRADRLSSLGTMAAGIIHEITQPLNAINVSVQTILYGFNRGWELDSEQSLNSLNLIVEQIKRISEIIRNMRAFARDGLPGEKEIDSLNIQIDRVLSLFGEQLKAHNINVELKMGVIPDIEMNSQQILQIILNLVTNARQALDESEIKNKRIKIKTYREKDFLCLEVADNGPGIPKNLREKIFDPFFSTKEVGKGTGLGLSISVGFANEHGGVIDFVNNEDGGASFILRLPLKVKHIGVET